jgi:hypothetical protein
MDMKQLKALEGKALFQLTRINSMNDGTFQRILHKVRQRDIVFWDGKQLTYLPKQGIEFFENGFKVQNCVFELLTIFEGGSENDRS